MRNAVRLLLATSLFIPVGVTVAGPAGATTKGPTCKTFTATVTNSPALPKKGVKTVVTSTFKTAGKIGGCTGGAVPGVTGATIGGSYKYKGNCATFVNGKGGLTSGASSSLKWSNGQSSTTTTTLKMVSKAGATPVVIQMTIKITKGQFSGTTSSSKVKRTTAAGVCTKTGLSRHTLTGTNALTFRGTPTPPV